MTVNAWKVLALQKMRTFLWTDHRLQSASLWLLLSGWVQQETTAGWRGRAQRVHVMYSLRCPLLWLAHDTNCQVEVKKELNQAQLNVIDIYCSLIESALIFILLTVLLLQDTIFQYLDLCASHQLCSWSPGSVWKPNFCSIIGETSPFLHFMTLCIHSVSYKHTKSYHLLHIGGNLNISSVTLLARGT